MSISLSEILPPPSNLSEDWAAKDPWFRQHGKTVNTSKSTAVVAAVKEPPPYGRRKNFLPRNDQDFGDGGAFPEIHVAQFPLGMGRSSRGDKKEKSNTLALTLDAKGKVQYDAIVKHGHDKDKVIYSKLSDTKSRVLDENDESLRKPDEEEVQNLTEKTRLALEKLTQSKVEAALPVRHAEKLGPAQYIRYTPSQQGAQFNSGAQQGIIRMVEAQKDPMEPPKFKINQKIPRAPPSPPAPVIHSPTRKVTAKEQQEWKIPPCISNWKNAKGYTIPLDKRLAADGRGLQQVHINENFAKLSEALYIADRKAREAVEMRSTLERKLAQKEKEEKEQKMRMMAQKAREERAGIRREVKGGGGEVGDEEAAQRDQIRRDKLDERRRAKLRRDKDRDISEQIALGLPDAKVRTDETQFDQRLFNQSKGLDSGSAFDDETYAVYSKPWRTNEGISQSIYRPGKNLDKDIYGDDLDKIINTNKFVPDKGFSGAESSSSGVRREGPVAFEKSEGDDPFGLGQLLKSAKEGRKRGAGDQGPDSSSTATDFPSKRKK